MQSTALTMPGHKLELDGLRAVALSFVVLEHSFYPFIGGFIGVDLFFVLSGYLITTILYRELATTGRISLSNFYWRRFLRLSPALFTMLGIYLAGLAVYFLWSHKEAFAEKHLWALGAAATYSMNWNLALGIGSGAFLEHTWTLGIEEQFYLLWPLLLIAASRWLDRRRLALLCLALILACNGWRVVLWLQGVSPYRIYMGLDTRIDALMAGCGLALWPLSEGLMKQLARWVVIPVAVLLVALTSLTWESPAYQLGSTVIALAAAWVIAAVLGNRKSWLAGTLRLRPLTYLGRISYGLYLWHYPAFMAIQWLMPGALVGWLAAPVALAAAAASYHWIETPIREFGRRPLRRPILELI